MLGRRAAWIVIAVAWAFFLTSGGTYPGIADVQAQLVAQVFAVAILGSWLVIALLRPGWRLTTPLLIPVLAASAAYAAAGLFSQRPRLSLEPTIAGIGFALAFLFLTRLLADDWFRSRARVLTIAFVALVAVGYVGQVVIEWVTWWQLVGRIALPPLRPSFVGLFLGSPNLIATSLILAGPIAVTFIASSPARRPLVVTLAVIAALAIFLTGSRGGYIGAGTATLVGIGLLVGRYGPMKLRDMVVDLTRRRPIILAPVAVAFLGLLIAIPALAYRFAQGGADLRFDLWRSALAIFADHPILGGGPGTWVQLKVVTNPAGVQNIVVPHAHDLYIQALAELGVVGVLALAFLVVTVARRLFAASRRAPGPLGIEAGAVIAGVAGFAAQSVVDNLVNLPFVCLLVVWLVAWVEGGLAPGDQPTTTSDRANRESGRWLARRGSALVGVGLLGVLLVIPVLIRVDTAALDDAAGNSAAADQDWPTALSHFEAARAADPDFTLYQLQTASALARVGRTSEARALLAQAVMDDPLAINQIGLAVLDATLGNYPEAMIRARAAAALGIGEPTVALNAGIVGEAAGDHAFAVAEFATAIAWDPPLARSGFWDAPERVTSKGAIVAAARAMTDALDGALIDAYAGNPSEARSALEAMAPSSQRDVYVAACEWLGGDATGALARLGEITRRDPLDWFAAGWASRIARLSGDLATADRYASWAIAVEADAASSVIGEASVVPAEDDAASAGLPANYPWGVYLRPSSPYLLVPELTLIGVR